MLIGASTEIYQEKIEVLKQPNLPTESTIDRTTSNDVSGNIAGSPCTNLDSTLAEGTESKIIINKRTFQAEERNITEEDHKRNDGINPSKYEASNNLTVHERDAIPLNEGVDDIAPNNESITEDNANVTNYSDNTLCDSGKCHAIFYFTERGLK